MKCPKGCGEMFAGQLLWVCGWCGNSFPRQSLPSPEPPEMVNIPAGKFSVGSTEDGSMAQAHEKPCRLVHLDDYWISIYPITNAQYQLFIEATNRNAPVHWKARPPIGENGMHPVCFVSWYEAMAYCKWLSELTGHVYTLPTEAQWEKAARGGIWLDGDSSAKTANPIPERKFPNGNEVPRPDQANFAGLQGGTTKVGIFPNGSSPYGCMDVAGNVSEWCLDTYDPGFYEIMSNHNPCQTGEGEKALRGGSWRSEAPHIRCSNRYYYPPENCSYGIGFRVVRLGALVK